MRDRSFIIAVTLVGAIALLIVAGNIRDANTPLYGPPNVDEEDVMSKVKEGRLSFQEARFYSAEDGLAAASRAGTAANPPPDGGSRHGAGAASEITAGEAPDTGAGAASETGGSDSGKRDK